MASKSSKRPTAIPRSVWWRIPREWRRKWWKYSSQPPFVDYRLLPQAGYR